MTRALLDQAIAALEGVLDAPVGVAAQFWSCTGGVYEAVECNNAINALQAELAKPEPTQPAWQDAPTQPGDWVIVGKGFKSELQTGITQQEIDRVSSWPGRWFGPLPEDTK